MARADGGVGAVGQEICAIWGRSHVVTKLLAQCVYDMTPLGTLLVGGGYGLGKQCGSG